MEAKLIKIDRNGSKHYEGYQVCDRCQGRGLYATGTINGQLRITPVDGGICHKCLGAGKVWTKWIERTPEYQAKLDARHEAKLAKLEAERRAKWAEGEEERNAEQELLDRLAQVCEEERQAEEAKKATSQYVGKVGDKLEAECTYIGSPSYEVPSFSGYGTETRHIHTFKDAGGNTIVWKTSSSLWDLHLQQGDTVTVKGTVKAHDEYKGEKQTQLQRCKVTVLVHVKEQSDEEKRQAQYDSIKGGDFVWRMSYSQYKKYYADCETIVGSYEDCDGEGNRIRPLVKVIIREGRLVPSGTRGKHYSGYELTNEFGKHVTYMAICEENALKRAKQDYPEHQFTCTKIYNYH